jgi:hypothetical protein
MTDLNTRPQLAARAYEDHRALAQRALACELGGELELAVALIRRLQLRCPDAGDSVATIRVPGSA